MYLIRDRFPIIQYTPSKKDSFSHDRKSTEGGGAAELGVNRQPAVTPYDIRINGPINARDIIPVLLGTGDNSYSLARGFYDEFGLHTHVLGTAILMQCRYSRFITGHILPGMHDDDRFVSTLRDFSQRLREERPSAIPLLVACTDTSSLMLAHHHDELRDSYLFASPNGAIFDHATRKDTLYRLIRKAGVPTPSTTIYSYEDFAANRPVEEPSDYPLAVKPSNCVSYLDIDFPGRKKAYIVESSDELEYVLRSSFSQGYRESFVIQEFIPGNDGGMRTLNAYVNSDGSIGMMCLGNPVMEEYSPSRIGNYSAIIAEGDKTIYEQAASLIQTSGWTGFCNLDLKYDPRDRTFKFLDFNGRPGGSSDFTSRAGFSLARYVMNDIVLKHTSPEPALCFTHHLWSQVPKKLLVRYAPEGPAKQEALQLIRRHQWSRSAFNAKDTNIRRLLGLLRWQLALARDYRRYAPKNPDTSTTPSL